MSMDADQQFAAVLIITAVVGLFIAACAWSLALRFSDRRRDDRGRS